MDRGDLPDMYTQAQGRAVPEGECGHIRQIMTAHVTYVSYVTPWQYHNTMATVLFE